MGEIAATLVAFDEEFKKGVRVLNADDEVGTPRDVSPVLSLLGRRQSQLHIASMPGWAAVSIPPACVE